MRELGITGAVRGKKVITTIPDGSVERAPDLLDRKFVASAPNRCWVADFTYVKTWSGIVYVAFVVDTFSRRITGWSASHSKETQLVLDALEMALRQRDREGRPPRPGELIHHSDAGSQYTSFRLAEHLEKAEVAASIGSVGDAYDNALMESTIGLFKTELIKPGRPWKTLSQVTASHFALGGTGLRFSFRSRPRTNARRAGTESSKTANPGAKSFAGSPGIMRRPASVAYWIVSRLDTRELCQGHMRLHGSGRADHV
nr:IS3 family transposase [Streptomyces sp. NBC_00830]